MIVPNTSTYAPVTVTNLTNGLTGSSTRSFSLSFGGNELIASKFDPQYILVPESDGKLIWDVCLCDMDIDGDLDAVVSYRQSKFLTLLKNNGSLNTTIFNKVGSKIELGEEGNILLCEDVNGDGKSDIIVSSNDAEIFNIQILKSNSDGGLILYNETPISFKLPQQTVNGTLVNRTANRILLADIDLDGKKDLIVGSANSPSVFIYRNESTKTAISFNPATPFQIKLSAGGTLDYIQTGRINQDGLPDLVVATINSANFFILENQSTTNNFKFGAPVTITDISDRENIRIGDFDNDGLDDLAHVSRGNQTVTVYRNTSSGSIISMAKSTSVSLNGAPLGLDVGDLNGDGLIDLAVTTVNIGLRLFPNTSTVGNISFTTPVAITLNKYQPANTTQKVARNIKIGDINGDAKPDLVFAFNSLSGETGEFSVITNRNCIEASISPTNLSFCYDTPIKLSGSKASGSTYSWSTNIPAATFNNNTLSNVQLTVPGGSPASITVQLTITSSDGNCTDMTSEIFNLTGGSVPVSPTINAPSSPICIGDNITLSTPFTGGNYLWTNPSGTEFTTSTLNISNATASDVGLYTLRVQSTGGCYSEQASVLLDIDIPPTAEIFNSNPIDNFCEGETIVLSIPDYGAYSQEWFKDGVSTSLTTKSINVTQTGSYRVDLISDANNCVTSSEEYDVRAVPEPSAMISANEAICINVPMTFEAESTGEAGFAMTHSWDFKDGSAVATGASVSHAFSSIGTYLVELTSSYADIEMCENVITFSVTVSTIPEVTPTTTSHSFESDGFTILKCPSDSVRLELPQNYQSYKWLLNGDSIKNDYFIYAKTSASGQSQEYTAEVVSEVGCSLTTEVVTIANFEGSGIDITAEKFQIVDDEIMLDASTRSVSLTASTVGGSDYRWRANDRTIFNDTTNATTIVTPREGETTVTVLANDANGCRESRTIQIVKPGLQAKKAFSPNGDPFNDCWEIINADDPGLTKNCIIYIFDSKGSVIFEKKGPFEENCVWTGQIKGSGSAAPAGIYYYVLKCDKKSTGLTGSILLAR